MAKLLGLPFVWHQCWNLFLLALSRAHIRIVDNRDEVVWVYDVSGGQYKVKFGNQALVEDRIPDPIWWWKHLWKPHGPPKRKILMWLILSGKLLTLDVLQKRSWCGPSICISCKENREDLSHLFIHCKYSVTVGIEVRKFFKLEDTWSKNSADDCLKDWFAKRHLKQFRALPLVVSWSIWAERNSEIFETRRMLAEIVAIRAATTFSQYSNASNAQP